MIHTTHGKAIEAYKVLGEIWSEGWFLTDSRLMLYLRDQMNPEVQFHDMKVGELLKKYNPKHLENGSLQFEIPEDAEAFRKDIDEMQNMEIDINADPIVLDMEMYKARGPKMPVIPPKKLEQLVGFIEMV